MQLIETSMNQRGQLPLPAAHVVIDIRGISDDRAIEWLQVEVADLASEMKSRDVYHWRYLTDFLSFMRINPNGSNAEKPDQDDLLDLDEASSGLVGRVHDTASDDMLFSENMRDPENAEGMPFNLFEQKINQLLLEIDRVRNNRIAAVKDLNPAAIPGRSRRDSTVRVVFLADVDHPESLTSAAIYADRLKSYYRKFERQGHQPMLNTVVVCLSNTGEARPPIKLIQGLSLNNKWDHIDSLILSENYREDAALISSTTQAYIAELMLYVLLVIPPFPVSASQGNGHANTSSEAVEFREGKQLLSLPANTFVVGLAALEYSARWGQRWLNFGLAKDSIDILRQKPENPGKEKIALADVATNWFMGWRQNVQATIPDRVPGELDDASSLDGIRKARLASQSDKVRFTARHFSFQMGKSTIKDLNAYLDSLTATYVSSNSEPALQDALVQGSSQIMQVLHEKKQQPIYERDANELSALQIEAERVLNHPKFFRGATGAIPRALMQLDALNRALEHFQRDHLQKPLNPQSTKDSLENRKSKLASRGKDMINNLKEHLAHWPYLVGKPLARLIMAIATLVLIAFLTAVAVFTGAAWLHHLLFMRFEGLLPYVDNIFLGVPMLALIAAVVVLLLLLIELTSLRSALFNKKTRGLYIEVAFLTTLIAISILGWLTSFSIYTLDGLPDDTLSLHYLAWLAFIPDVALAAIAVVLFVLLIEGAYFAWWLGYLRRERRRIISELRKQHRNDIQEVIGVIADEVALGIAQQAELCDSKGGPAPYLTRLSRLSDLLDKLAMTSLAQQQLAAERLLYKQGEMQLGASSKSDDVWLNLHIRDERLEMEPLTDAYKGLREQLVKEHQVIQELAKVILRCEGVEAPRDIERELLEKQDVLASNERRLQLFLTSLAAITMRFAVDPVSQRNVEPIDEEYQYIEAYTAEEIPALTSLVKALNKRMSQVMLETSSNKGRAHRPAETAISGKSLAAQAVALWGHFFWVHSNPHLDELLMTDGILKHLERQLGDDYDPRAIMRRLLMHTVLFGRSLQAGQRIDLYLLLAPSEQSYHFRQGLKSLALPRIIDFPDVERILLLGVKRFVAEPMQLSAPIQVNQPVLPNTADNNQEQPASGVMMNNGSVV